MGDSWKERASPWALLAGQFRNVLIVILLAATALSALLCHGVEAVAITVIVIFAVLLGFVQEYRAGRAIEALREMAAPRATVIRDGVEVDLPAREVVPGDVLVLTAGNLIAADARLLQAANLKVQEAPLTGESTPVDKYVDTIRETMLLAGGLLLGQGVYLVAGLHLVSAPRQVYLNLLNAPRLMIWKSWQMFLVLVGQEKSPWIRTKRNEE